jgi:exoribonuclease-2
MLDHSVLQQLNQLKTNIRADKNLATGKVRGTQGRFGFIQLDDGREAFLPPDEMQKVLPGDVVEAIVTKNPDPKSSKLEAVLEKLIETKPQTLIGRYVVRGKGHFFAVDMPQLSRWVFIPPKARGKAKVGDYLLGSINKHPFDDGKGLAKISKILGSDQDPGIEHLVTRCKHSLIDQWNKEEQTAAAKILNASRDFNACVDTTRHDLSAQQFITIDSENTRDMDDALSIKSTTTGWLLSVAIADPSSFIRPDSILNKTAQLRGSTAYLSGGAITMLPEELAHDGFSLVAGENRPVVVCHLNIEQDGSLSSTQFELAIIKSQHKLSYINVASYLQADSDTCDAIAPDCQPLITSLHHCSQALNSFRQANMLIMEDKPDYEYQLDDAKHITNITRHDRNPAQQIVEEAMLATNCAAGKLFSDHFQTNPNSSGIFSTHGGFRPERLDAIKQVIAEDHPELAQLNLTQADDYKTLIKTLQNDPQHQHTLVAFRMMLQAGVFSTTPKPHMGMGMTHYATITSPIRRYNDLHNHRVIKAIVSGTLMPAINAEQLSELQQNVSRARHASRDLDQWLGCLFLEQHKDKVMRGTVTRVTSQGINATSSAWGLNGFIKLPPKEYRFDPERMTLTNEQGVIKLGDEIEFKLDKVDMDKKRMNFVQVKTETEKSSVDTDTAVNESESSN